MVTKYKFSGIYEREIDLFLLEELSANLDFARWFVGAAHGNCPAIDTCETAAHSVVVENGESDLEITYRNTDGTRTTLLIENKILATLQPAQALRYRERADGYRQIHGPDHTFLVTITAPKSYFKSPDDKKGFDSKVTFEQICDRLALDTTQPSRAAYKQRLVETAIARSRPGYDRIVDTVATEFRDFYVRQVREAGGPLHLTPGLEIPNASTFIRFSQGELAKGLSLYHKLRPGCVDLEIAASSKRIAAISRIFQDQGYDDIAICEAGKSVALRIVLEPVCFGDDLQSRRRKLQDAIVAGTRLYSIGVKLGSELGRFVNANRTSHGPEQTKRNESSGKNDDVSTKLEAALAIVKADPSPKGYAKANAVLEGSSIVLESRSGKAGIVLTGPVPDMQAFREKK